MIWGMVLAAGDGRRFGGPKQFRRLRGRRLVDRSIAAISPLCAGVSLAVPSGSDWEGPPVEQVVTGGATHAETTRALVDALPAGVEVVLLTAASHPLVDTALAARVLGALGEEVDAAAPLLPLADAPMTVDADRGVRPLPERGLHVAQMPYALRAPALRRAVAGAAFVEELEAIHRLGGRIVAVPGVVTNIHVATVADLELAEAILSRGPTGS